MGAASLVALALTGALTSVSAGRGDQAPAATHAGAAASSRHAGPRAAVTRPAATRDCVPTTGAGGYVDPLAGAQVTPERIDQGVDYAGSGTLVALGPGRITYLATSATGWPGAFIEYRLLAGPDAGCYVYYAEGVTPAAGLQVGAVVAAGQAVASIIPGWPTGVELGWGAGVSTKTYAVKRRQWSAADDADNVASGAGKSFSALIAALGGPAGKVEG